MAGPIKIAIVGDTKDFASGLDKAQAKMGETAKAADRAADKIDSSFAGAADAADNMGSRSSQAAGGLGDLGGALAMMPGPLAGVGAGMEAAAPAIMGVTGAADLMNLAMTSSIVTTTKAKIATIGKTVADKAQAAGAKAAAAAQWLLNAAMTANPIGLVIAGLVALVAGLVIAYKKSERFREIVNAAFGAVKAVTVAVFGKVKDAIAGFGRLAKRVFENIPIVLLIRHWDTIKTKTAAAFGWVRDKITGLIGAAVGKYEDGGGGALGKIWSLVNFFGGLGGKISNKVGGAFDGLKDSLRGALKWIESKWNSFDLEIGPFKIPDWVPGVGGKKFHIPDIFPDINIPGLARGGITTGPTLAMVGDNPGGREAVIPLDRYDLSGGQMVDVLKAILAALEGGSGIDYERLAAAISSRPNYLTMNRRDAARLVGVGLDARGRLA